MFRIPEGVDTHPPSLWRQEGVRVKLDAPKLRRNSVLGTYAGWVGLPHEQVRSARLTQRVPIAGQRGTKILKQHQTTRPDRLAHQAPAPLPPPPSPEQLHQRLRVTQLHTLRPLDDDGPSCLTAAPLTRWCGRQAARFPTFDQCGGEYDRWIKQLNAASSYMTKLHVLGASDGGAAPCQVRGW